MLRRLLDSPWTYFVGAGVLLVLAFASQFEVRFPARSKAPASAISELAGRDDLNVVFLVIDTLRADRLGIYGYDRPTSPILDGLARSGVVFERALAQSSWTKTSMASLWTGTHPARHGVLRYNHAVPAAARLPAEIFREAGYRTAGIWRNGWVAPNFGFSQGFDVYLRPKPGRERAQIQRNNPSSNPLQGTDEDLTRAAMDFLDTFGDERFFLYLHYMDVHQYVYDQAAARFGTSYSDAYDQSIHWIDRLVGALVQALDDRQILGRTLIVLASDHGEAFREHGFEGHARNLHREVTFVPLIFVFPFLLDPGLRVDTPVSNIDVWPTILDLVGLPALPGADGRSLVPLMLAAGGVGSEGQDGFEGRRLFSQLDRRWGRPGADPDPLLAVTEGDVRLFVPLENPDGAQLFDLATDPGEQQNLRERDPEKLAALRTVALEHAEASEAPWGAAPDEVELDTMRLEQLRALGYVIK